MKVAHDFEWLAGVMAQMDRREGGGQTHADPYVNSQLGIWIRALQAVEHAMRALAVASPAVPADAPKPREQRAAAPTAWPLDTAKTVV